MKRRTKSKVLLVVSLAVGIVLLFYLYATLAARTGSPSETTAIGNSSNGATSGQKESSTSLTKSNSLETTARYTVDSPSTGQWLTVQATSPIFSVSASDSGTIPPYSSLASLNQTSIGYECSQPASNAGCGSYEYVQQTGWFWDSSSHILTVHYLGGANVTLTVVEQP
ncbi:MAG: hypothetical protein OK456_09840 [Thaumarchaeota archaeon]|nr:hypothetical protein [Nitrososphaerota archaeon]